MRVKKKQYLIYLEIDRNETPEKMEEIIREAFRSRYTPRIRTLLTAINYKNLRTVVSQPLVITERELNENFKQEKVG
jgi:hypothetical protein